MIKLRFFVTIYNSKIIYQIKLFLRYIFENKILFAKTSLFKTNILKLQNT